MEHQPASLEVRDVVHMFGRFRALDGVSFEVAAGEVACLLGHSGCGKTTLLRTIAGLEEPTSGTVLLGGRAVTGRGVFVEPENRGVGLMFQDYALFPHLTVLDNVLFGLKRRRDHARAVAEQALDRVGLRRLASAYPETLSGGEQQRVALARAVAPGPALMLLDEPFSNLDRRTRDQIREETIGVLREAGITVVMVTHDPEEAMPVADRIVLMRAGRVVQTGSGEDLYRRPSSLFAARFFADWNEIEGICRNGRAVTPIGSFDASTIPDGAAAIVCIRPEGVRLSGRGEIRTRVVKRSFLGPANLFELRVEGLAFALRARAGSALALDVGDEVAIEIDRNAVLVLRADRKAVEPEACLERF